MNSDRNENAAWRTFGMLDADEATSFDEAVRLDPELKKAYLEMDHLTAAVAVASSIPIAPQAGQLMKLQHRLGINQPHRTNWFGITGWAAAAAITVVFLSQRTVPREKMVAQSSEPRPVPQHVPALAKPTPPITSPTTVVAAVNQKSSEQAPQKTKSTTATRLLTRIEPRQLTQKIETLEEEVEVLQRREKQRLEAQPDMAWPVVVRMRPIQLQSGKKLETALDTTEPTLTETLGDALAANQGAKEEKPDPVIASRSIESGDTTPNIISIYDPATLEGQLITTNFRAPNPNEKFELVADTDTGPVVLGSIPSTGDPTQTFSFATPPSMNMTGMSVISVIAEDGKPPQSTPIFSSLPAPEP
jgi:hypothetical protein